MRKFLTHLAGRLGAAAVLLAAAAGVSMAAAPAASAAPAIQQCYYTGGTGYSTTQINVQDVEHCPPFTYNLAVSIWQFSPNNTWVQVASGYGSVTYLCKGSTLRTHYETRAAGFANDDFYDYCN